MDRATVSCRNPDWRDVVYDNLYQRIEVDLIDFNYQSHGNSCELMARVLGFDFSLSRDANSNTAYFRRKTL